MSLKISIVTPSYNQGSFIKATIDSVLSQSYANIEYIVMDGGSTDKTLGILQSYNHEQFSWVSEPDNGQSHAINKGMVKTTGDIIAYINSDDVYEPGAFGFIAQYFEQHPDVMMAHGDCKVLDAAGHIIDMLKGNQYTIRSAFINRWHVPQPAVFWRREVMDTIGLFDENLNYPLDTDYWLRMIVAGYQPQYVSQVLASFRLHGQSKTVNHYDRFYLDWLNMLKKIFSYPDLPASIAELETHAYAYNNFHSGQKYWYHNQYQNARKLFAKVITNKAPIKLKIATLAYYTDTYIQLSRLWH